MKVYKIANRLTGLFRGPSARFGSSYFGHPGFSKIGKVWGHRGHAKQALRYNHQDELDQLEVVEYDVVESRRIPAREFLDASNHR